MSLDAGNRSPRRKQRQFFALPRSPGNDRHSFQRNDVPAASGHLPSGGVPDSSSGFVREACEKPIFERKPPSRGKRRHGLPSLYAHMESTNAQSHRNGRGNEQCLFSGPARLHPSRSRQFDTSTPTPYVFELRLLLCRPKPTKKQQW